MRYLIAKYHDFLLTGRRPIKSSQKTRTALNKILERILDPLDRNVRPYRSQLKIGCRMLSAACVRIPCTYY